MPPDGDRRAVFGRRFAVFITYCLLLGLIQGLTEFLPVSSSGHLALAEDLLPGLPSLPGGATALNVLLHLGTLIAVFIVFRRDLLPLPAAFLSLVCRLFSREKRRTERTKDEQLCLHLIFGTLPLVLLKLLDVLVEKVAGYSFVDTAEAFVASRPIVVGAILIFNGFLLYAADVLYRRRTSCGNFGKKQAFAVGIFQAFALLPGLSRSGATIAGGQFMGLSRAEALRFSFLLSVPAVLGASAVEVPDLVTASVPPRVLAVYFAAALVALLAGLCSLGLLKKLAKSSSFLPFSIYCWALGALAVLAGVCKLPAA